MTDDGMAKSYGHYLRLEELLDIQTTLTDAHDELQFIVVHQVSELWFKLLLFELTATRDAMDRDEIGSAVHYLERIREIVRVFMAGFEVIETMRPFDFLEFRSRLQPASGFQSAQFRELEFLSGLKDERYLKHFDGVERERLEVRLKERTVWDAFLELLGRSEMPNGNDEEVLSSIIRILKESDRHPLAVLTEALVDFDERVAIWRQRHLKMTLRMIGGRPGTGKDSVAAHTPEGKMSQGGVEYLRTTVDRVFFPLLWEARTFVER